MIKQKNQVILGLFALAICPMIKSEFIMYEHLGGGPNEQWGYPGRGDMESFFKKYFPNKKKLKVGDFIKKMESLRPDRELVAIAKAQVDQEIFWKNFKELQRKKLERGDIKLKTGRGINEAVEVEQKPNIFTVSMREIERIVPTKRLFEDDIIDLQKDSGHIHIWTKSKTKGDFTLTFFVDGKKLEEKHEGKEKTYYIDDKQVSEEEYYDFKEEHKKKE